MIGKIVGPGGGALSGDASVTDVKSGKTFYNTNSRTKLTGTFAGQTKTVAAGTSNVTVSPDSGKYLSSVTVQPTPSQTKSVTPGTSQQTVSPDSGKLLSSVTVSAIPSRFKSTSVINAEPLSIRRSSVVDAGDKTSRKYFITAINGSYGIEASNDSQFGSYSTPVTGSTAGSGSGSSTDPCSVKSGTVTGYRYYRVYIDPYNNGSKGSASLAIGV